MFYPFNLPRVRRLDVGGIFDIDTIYSVVNTTANTVTYGICPMIWRQLPCKGIILLNIAQTATGATAGSLVALATNATASQASSTSTTTTTTTGRALLNGSGTLMPTEEITTGNRYLIYYDKRTGVFQTVNHIVLPTAA